MGSKHQYGFSNTQYFVAFAGFVQSPAIRDVAYYRVTTRFVNDILDGYGGTGIEKMYITGASLGGGLAVITGAQTEAYTGA